MKAIEKQDAFAIVLGAAEIQSQTLDRSLLQDRSLTAPFKEARKSYIRRLNDAIRTVQGTRFEDAVKVSERVSDLDLAELVALQYAVEDRIRSLVPRSPLA